MFLVHAPSIFGQRVSLSQLFCGGVAACTAKVMHTKLSQQPSWQSGTRCNFPKYYVGSASSNSSPGDLNVELGGVAGRSSRTRITKPIPILCVCNVPPAP